MRLEDDLLLFFGLVNTFNSSFETLPSCLPALFFPLLLSPIFFSSYSSSSADSSDSLSFASFSESLSCFSCSEKSFCFASFFSSSSVSWVLLSFPVGESSCLVRFWKSRKLKAKRQIGVQSNGSCYWTRKITSYKYNLYVSFQIKKTKKNKKDQWLKVKSFTDLWKFVNH